MRESKRETQHRVKNDGDGWWGTDAIRNAYQDDHQPAVLIQTTKISTIVICAFAVQLYPPAYISTFAATVDGHCCEGVRVGVLFAATFRS